MKKFSLFLMVLLVSVLLASAVIAGASATTVLFEDYYRGEYADFKNGTEEDASKDVIIFFGSVNTLEEQKEYGVAVKKDGASTTTYYKAENFNEQDQNKFGIAISVGGDASAKNTGLQSGTYTVRTYERAKSDVEYTDCIYSAEQTVVIDTDAIQAPSDVAFNKANGTVSWTAVSGAQSYLVKLYAGETTIFEDAITDTKIDFSDKIRALSATDLSSLDGQSLKMDVTSYNEANKLGATETVDSGLVLEVLNSVSDIKAMNSTSQYGVLASDITVSESDYQTFTASGDWGLNSTCVFYSFKSTIDGLGHKIVVPEYTFTTSYALFRELREGASLLNLVIDADVTINYAYNARRIGVIGYSIVGDTTLTDCYVKTRIDLVDGQPTNRIHLGTLDNKSILTNCVFDVDVAQNGQDASGVVCTLKGTGNAPTVNNCVYVANDSSATVAGIDCYADIDAFITAFKSSTITNQSTYTAWSVDQNNHLFLLDTQLTFDTVAGPTDLAIEKDGTVSWTAIEDVTSYTVKLAGDSTVYTQTVSATTFNFSEALATLSGEDLDKLNGKYLTVAVSANVQNANCEESKATSTFTVKVLASDADLKAMMPDTGSTTGGANVGNTYGVLKNDITVTTEDLTYTFVTNLASAVSFVYPYGTLDETSVLDGLGRKIIVNAEVEYSYGLIRRAAGRIQNLGIETNVKTTSTSADGKRVCLLGVEVRNTLEVNNCYFDGDINFVAGTFRAHTGLIDNAKYNNCVFDINLLANGEDVAATSSNYAYLRLSPANSGTPTFTNCAYIVNDTNTSAASANTSKITNATVCADLNTFISAFKANEVTNQSTYTAWSVDANDKLYLVGTQIA